MTALSLKQRFLLIDQRLILFFEVGPELPGIIFL